MFATALSGNKCMYKGGMKDDPCYIVKGQRNVPVRGGKNTISSLNFAWLV